MKAIGFGVIAAICGIAAVIVFPYVLIDLFSRPPAKALPSDWPAWVQAIGSILAVAAAASIAVYQQLENQRLQQGQREHKNIAARAVLPATLSLLAEYANDCLDLLQENRDIRNIDGSRKAFVAPELPINLMKDIKDCIEYADDGPQKRLAELLEKLQIQHARLSSIDKKSLRVNMLTTDHNLNGVIVDTLDIYARIELLFPYARRSNNDDPGEPTKETMRGAANIGHFIDDEEVMQLVDWRYD